MLKSSSLCLYSSNLGIFWLKIEPFWPFEEISIFSNGGHLGYRTDEIFYELWTFAYFDRLCKLEKRGDEIKKKSFSLKLLWTTQGSYRQSLVEIGTVVSEKKIFFKFHPPFFLYERWTFAYFDRLCKLEKRGDEI
jgi:hypothetical protein